MILPASTAPADVVLAARYLREAPGDRSQVEHRAWDESVKSLTNYPEVLRWMDENLHWTKQLGEAFAEQPADVMQAVQRLRAKARAAGTLVDTPQQQILAEPDAIRIVPAQPDVIYVPYYQPEVVFVDRPVYYPRPFMTFGVGVAVGSWLAFDCDWRRHAIWVGDRHRHWNGHDWHRPVVAFGVVSGNTYTRNAPVRQWRPPAQPPRTTVALNWHARTEIARPSPVGATTTHSYAPRPRLVDGRRETNDLPPANPLPRSYAPRAGSDFSGPRANPRTAESSFQSVNNYDGSSAPARAATAPAPTPAPSVRANTGDGGSNRRGRQSSGAVSAPLPSAPSLPMANAAPAFQNPGPVAPPQQHRSYSRPAPAPAAAPSLPMVSAPARTNVTGPVAPPQTAPAPAPAAAPAAAAPARNDPGDDRRGRREAHER